MAEILRNDFLLGILLIFFRLTWIFKPVCAHSTNSTGPEINDHVSLQ